MRYLVLALTIAFILVLVPVSHAQGAVILVIDSLGSSYVYQDLMASYVSGVPIHKVYLNAMDEVDGRYTLLVPRPETEYGHSVIVTGYSAAEAQTIGFYHSNMFDALRDRGYLCLGILETGDSAEMLDSLDVAVREKNDSVYKPRFEFILNNRSAPQGVVEMMKSYPALPSSKQGKDPNAAYIRYNNWSLDFATELVEYMNDSEPGMAYVLFVNVGGLDEAGHILGCVGYEAVLASLDTKMLSLIDVCRRSNVTLFITADHGMSFKDENSKGSHASATASSRNESTLVPLLIYSSKIEGKGSGLYGQQDIAPTILSLLDCPNTLSMCDGNPLPLKNNPTLYLRSMHPVNVTVTGPDRSSTILVNGICAIEGLNKGVYIIRYGGYEKDVDLLSDALIDIPDESGTAPLLPPLAAYAATGIVSLAGILATLRFIWRK